MTLARGLTRQEAESASARLNQQGIAVSTRADSQGAERFQLEVAETAVPQAVEALAPRARTLPDLRRERRDLPLVPTRSAEARAREARLDAKLELLLKSLPGVADVAVQSTITPARETLDDLRAEPRPPAIELQLQIVREAEAPALGERVRARIASDPELAQAAIALDERALPPVSNRCAPLTHLGPITLTAAGLSTLKLWLSLSMLVHMLSAAAVIALVRHSQRLRRTRSSSEER